MSYQSTVLADAPALYWRLGDGPDAAYRAAVLADAPVAYWPLGAAPAGAGTLYRDRSAGGGYDARLLLGTATAVAGPIAGTTAPHMTVLWQNPGGQPGTGDALYVTHTAGLPHDGDPYTIEAWLRPRVCTAPQTVDTTVTNGNTLLPYWMSAMAWGPQNGAGPFLGTDLLQNDARTTVGAVVTLDSVTDEGYLESYDPLNNVNIGRVGGPFDGGWHHLAISDDAAGTVTFYLDGVQVHQETGVGTSNGLVADVANVLFLGDPGYAPTARWPDADFPAPAQEPYAGALAHCAIYPAALDGTHVAAHYAAASIQTLADSSGNAQTGDWSGGVTLPAAGLLRADANTAAALDGSSGLLVQESASTLPAAASIEVWLRTTTTQGGVLAQFATADTTQRDLTLYLRTDGTIALRAGSTEIARSGERPLNDGRIYHVVGTLDEDTDLWLYVNGAQVAHAGPGVSVGASFEGRWQIGSGQTDDLSVPPMSAALAATIDEVAIYT